MSRIGKKILELPNGVTLSQDSSNITVKGPKGELIQSSISGLTLSVDGNQVTVVRDDAVSGLNAKHGLLRSILSNMIKGVSVGFEKDMEIFGVGYKVQLQGSELVFALGFSHPVKVVPPTGVTFIVDGQTKIKVLGIDIQQVGQVAANLRALRPPDAYKGKGVRYAKEVIRKKQGKSVKK